MLVCQLNNKKYKNISSIIKAVSKIKGPSYVETYYNKYIKDGENQPRCIITNRPLSYRVYKETGKFYGSAIRNCYNDHNKNIAATQKAIKKYTFVDELDAYFMKWKPASRMCSKNNLNKKHIYNKYFYKSSKCRLDGCKKNVPFEMVPWRACSSRHYCKSENYKKGDYSSDDLKFVCLLDGERFARAENLTTYIKQLGWKPEDYYNKFLQKSENEGMCKWCNKKVPFFNINNGYRKFCSNSKCNVMWYNKHEDRAKKCASKISKTHKRGDVLPNQIGYWTKRGISLKDAKKKISFRQTTNSIDAIMRQRNCSRKEAIKIRQDITARWLQSMPNMNYSSISQELFWKLYTKIKDNYNNIYFATLQGNSRDDSGKNHEYVVKTERSRRLLDFYIEDNNKVIEFDGTYWHRGDNSDKMREQEIINIMGCSFYRVKEEDYYQDKNKVIHRCIKYLING